MQRGIRASVAGRRGTERRCAGPADRGLVARGGALDNVGPMTHDPLAPLSDDDLLAQYAAGDRQAPAYLTQRLLPRVYRLALRLLGDAAEAEDVAQEAMMRLWRIAPQWRSGDAQISTWLYRVTANLCTDRLRKVRPMALEPANEPEDTAPTAAQRLQDAARRDALQNALDLLPDRQRKAVVLRHIEGLGNAEIAAIMEISAEAVESLTARGKRALARHLAAERDALGFEDDTTTK